MGWRGAGWEDALMFCMAVAVARSRMPIDPWHPCNAGTEHVGFPSTRQALLVCTKRVGLGGMELGVARTVEGEKRRELRARQISESIRVHRVLRRGVAYFCFFGFHLCFGGPMGGGRGGEVHSISYMAVVV